MNVKSGKFQDLGIRVASGLVLLIVGFAALFIGGLPLVLFVSLLGALVAWEQARMLGAENAYVIGGLTFVALGLAGVLSWEVRAPLILAATGISVGMMTNNKALFTVSHVTAAAGALSFLVIASTRDSTVLAWLIGVVVMTDIAGYFAGKRFGGPKFWPSISPKKTWSGTIGGWAAAGILGFILSGGMGGAFAMVLASILLSFSSQLGDIFESFVKRRAGVKDSSGLIPGHGGVWDRFDGMLAAALAYWPVSLVFSL